MFQPDQIAAAAPFQFTSPQIFLILGGWVVSVIVAGISGAAFWNFITGKTKAETTEIVHRTDQQLVNAVDERVERWREIVLEVTDEINDLRTHRAGQDIIILRCLDRLERGQEIIEECAQSATSKKYLDETRAFIAKIREAMEEDDKQLA